jgi:Ca2+-binding RTX toxin-like protein
MALIEGDNSDNTLTGTAGDDSIYGYDGNDILYGGFVVEFEPTGNDSLYGGMGDDKLFGYDGNDNLYGEGGNDILLGAEGNDNLYGGDGNDTLDSGDGNDYLSGGSGDDTYYAGTDTVYEALNAGTDTIVTYLLSYTLETNFENLTLYRDGSTGIGNSLNNTINGSCKNSHLYGLDGDDYLKAGWGGYMEGGNGDDTYVYYENNVIVEAADAGTDTVEATNVASYTLCTNVENLTLCGPYSFNGTGNGLNNMIRGNSNNNFLYGLDGNDFLSGGSGNDTMYGGSGNDTYDVNSASDVVVEVEGEGTDRVNAYINYTLSANVDNLVLYGTATTGTGNTLNNMISGNSNANFLYGLDGDDYLNGGSGNDTMYGGSGNDTYLIDSASDSYFEDADSGTDTVYAYVSDTLHFNVEKLYLYGSATTGIGNELINEIIGNSSSNSLYGQGGNDSLYGNGGNDILNGGTGNDTMYGGTGNDTCIIDTDSDSYFEDAGSGTDTVYAYVNETLRSNVERLYLYGTATTGSGNELNNGIVGNSNANTLYGQGGNDSLYGNGGNDILNGGTGTDTMNGGTGNDTYIIDSAGDFISEAEGAGTDRVNATISYALGANVEILVLYGAATNGTGNALDNTISGNSNANILYGLDGNDTLNGGTGTDTMAGGAGNDTYIIDSVGDIISEAEGAGTDRVNATISYTLGSNVETLVLYGAATNGTGNALDNTIVGNSNANTLRGYAGNDILYGYDGNDVLNGFTGNDTMAGGAGDDTCYVDSAGDVVIEAAGAGTDKVNATISYTLGVNLETLVLYGTATNGTGNVLGNTIVGNSNANTLSGLAGNDYLSGDAGNDTLNGGTGNDTIVGGIGNDSLYGNDGNDYLNGGDSNDYLNGGTGQDNFAFRESGLANCDTIVDFSHTDDTIVLKDILDGVTDSFLTGLSFTGTVLNAGSYFEGAGSTGNGTEASGIYNNTTTGEIWYNPTSGVAGDSVVICTVGTPDSPDNTDFVYSA